ncbi:PEP-CTERM domain protein [Zooshikella ganghwensis]|uniref:PEP-CTERM domain protein n=1 Tax=Zooshikella ganghwensis TaxID=202772 RepID=UPI000408B980|nr:PEP-CTERM domain protein [Zooshikella ganghwensis]
MKTLLKQHQNYSINFMEYYSVLLLVLLLLMTCNNAKAVPLNLTLQDTPDINSAFISVGYAADTDTLSANGFALNLDDDGTLEAIAGGTFGLTATIDSTGALSSGGILSIGGTIASLGFNSGTLLSGSLSAFGFGLASDPFEFLFTITGGDAASLYGGIGSNAGVILSLDTGFTGSFENSFRGTGLAVSDVAPIPVPTTLALISCGLFGLAGSLRKKIK